MLNQVFALVFIVNVTNMGTNAPLVANLYDSEAECEQHNSELLASKAISKKGDCIPLTALEGLPVLSIGYFDIQEETEPAVQPNPQKKDKDI